MEQLGVIAKIQEPTDWCSRVVIVPKPNGQVRISADLTKLNQSACRERHPLPAVEQILAQLHEVKVFTKLMPIPVFGKCQFHLSQHLDNIHNTFQSFLSSQIAIWYNVSARILSVSNVRNDEKRRWSTLSDG